MAGQREGGGGKGGIYLLFIGTFNLFLHYSIAYSVSGKPFHSMTSVQFHMYIYISHKGKARCVSMSFNNEVGVEILSKCSYLKKRYFRAKEPIFEYC